MSPVSINCFGYSFEDLTRYFTRNYGKGRFHAAALFKQLYSNGNAEVSELPDFAAAPDLARRIEQDFEVVLPEIQDQVDTSGTQKFTLGMADGAFTESVIIPMAEWDTLCISSQVGCSRGCVFCETGRMGLMRNLTTEEVISQWAAVRFRIQKIPRNIVFMGMGEPFDNFDSVMKTIDILSDQRGAAIPKRRISISTSGHVDGIRRLTALEHKYPEKAYRTLHLAVSLNAPDDVIRSNLMPINRIWPMSDLKAVLLDAPQSRIKDSLYFEYVLIPGVNDEPKHAEKIVKWMDGLTAKVNLIPYHPTGTSPWTEPENETINRFHEIIRASGRECRTRGSRGKGIDAACGMLGKKGRCGSTSP